MDILWKYENTLKEGSPAADQPPPAPLLKGPQASLCGSFVLPFLLLAHLRLIKSTLVLCGKRSRPQLILKAYPPINHNTCDTNFPLCNLRRPQRHGTSTPAWPPGILHKFFTVPTLGSRHTVREPEESTPSLHGGNVGTAGRKEESSKG